MSSTTRLLSTTTTEPYLGGHPPTPRMMRILRVVLMAVQFFLVLSLIVAIGRPETGALEKVVLGMWLVGLVSLTPLVQSSGRRHIRA